MSLARLHVEFLNVAEFERDFVRATQEVVIGTQRGVKLGCEEGAAVARATTQFKDRTGNLRAKIRGGIEMMAPGGAVGFIEAKAKYASFVEEGTVPHFIRPKLGRGVEGPLQPGQTRGNRKARAMLRWVDAGGAVHFAKIVRHPGTRPRPFMGPAMQKAEAVITREVELGVERAQHILDG